MNALEGRRDMGENDISKPNGLKTAAADFLLMVSAGDIGEAYEMYVDIKGKHHNSFMPRGFEALRHAMEKAISSLRTSNSPSSIFWATAT